MLSEFVLLLGFLAFGFLLGGFPSAVIVCKISGLPDPRLHGSKNPGATNVLRLGNKKSAAIVLLLDGLKGISAVLFAAYFELNLLHQTIVLAATFLGHIYPIFLNFKGGKGIATFLGGLFALNFWAGLIFAAIWIFIAKVVKISSLSALIATLLTPIYFYLITQNQQATLAISIICLIIFFTHKANIQRLLNNTETKIKK